MKSIYILIIEDEAPIRDMIKFALEHTEFEIIEASNANEATDKIATKIPDLILLDWMLPGISGIDFVKQLKKNDNSKNIPIIMLTARAEEESKIKGLELGADDYITKPFSPRELVARIKTVLRRGGLVTPNGVIQLNELSLDVNAHIVKIKDDVIALTAIEYKLLYFFLTHQGRTYNRTQLLDNIWGGEQDISERTVDVQIRRLRSRLQPYGYDKHIKTIRSYGYQFVGNAS